MQYKKFNSDIIKTDINTDGVARFFKGEGYYSLFQTNDDKFKLVNDNSTVAGVTFDTIDEALESL